MFDNQLIEKLEMSQSECCVPSCKSKINEKIKKVQFFKFPNDVSKSKIREKRRIEWLKAIRLDESLSEEESEKLVICSKHFATGQPAKESLIYHKDWIPNRNLPRMILGDLNNLPEDVVQFDKPDYVSLAKNFNEQRIELDLINKYMTESIFDQNGYYRNTFDSTNLSKSHPKTEHNYSIPHPACVNFNATYFCNICWKNCMNLFTFNKHITVHILRNDVNCAICSQTFLSTMCLNVHLADSHKIYCTMCERLIPSAQLNAHLRANQNQKFNSDILKYRIPDSKKTLYCIICMKKLNSTLEFNRHLLHHRWKKS